MCLLIRDIVYEHLGSRCLGQILQMEQIILDKWLLRKIFDEVKCHLGQMTLRTMSLRTNVTQNKCQLGQMVFRTKSIQDKQHLGQIAFSTNSFQDNCPLGLLLEKMSFWTNVIPENCHFALMLFRKMSFKATVILPIPFCQWKGSKNKQSTRWQQVSQIKASAFCIW